MAATTRNKAFANSQDRVSSHGVEIMGLMSVMAPQAVHDRNIA
jgi:hypothetical protein